MYWHSRITITALLSTVCLTGCDPKETYKKVILDEGFIPYENPVAHAGAGVIQYQQAKKPENVVAVAERRRCFDHDGSLWRENDVDLGSRVKRFSLNFDAAANAILVAGNNQLELKLGTKFVRQMEISFSGAKIEETDLFSLGEFYQSMSEPCKRALDRYPFAIKALKVSSMEFAFKKESGGYLQLDAKILEKIIDIKPNVRWEIIDNYILSVKTPKYIGYQMARFSADHSGAVEKIATDTDQWGYWRFLSADPALFIPAMIE